MQKNSKCGAEIKLMFKRKIKKFLKESPLVFSILVGIIFLYLKFTYLTIRWRFIWPDGYTMDDIKKEKGVLFALWHNRLAYSIKIFGEYQPVKALASPHSDGKIIGKIVNMWGYGVIEGSTYKKATGAVREIIKELNAGNNIVITPDGPRGPVYQINSAITRIASKYNKKLFAASCEVSNCFELKSWDQMLIPIPFSKVTVKISKPLELTGDEEVDNMLLKTKLDKAIN